MQLEHWGTEIFSHLFSITHEEDKWRQKLVYLQVIKKSPRILPERHLRSNRQAVPAVCT